MAEELTKPDSFIETELKRFETNLEITKEELIVLVNSVKDLTISGPDDKIGLKAVIDGRKLLKSKRVFIEKASKNTRESAVRFQKAVIQRESEYVSLIEPTEDVLAQREEFYYAERERIRLEEEKKESDRIQAMIDKLNAVNYAVDFHELKALTDVQFENILAEATTKYHIALEEEKAEKQRQYELRLAEETRLAQAQKEQEEREKIFLEEQMKAQAENERKQKELEKKEYDLRKEQEERQRLIDEQNEKIRKEQQAKEEELAARQRELDRQERDRIEALAKEQRLKEEAERKKQEEIDRKKREKEEKEERLLQGSDVEKFTEIFRQIDAIRQSNIWGTFKSKKGKESAIGIQDALNLAVSYTSIAPQDGREQQN